LVDFHKCPSADSPRAFPWSPSALPLAQLPQLPQGGSSCSETVTIGASVCTPCPASRPHTWDVGSTSEEACKRCPENQFFDAAASRCRACRPPCDTPYEYEVVPCTDTTQRFCVFCDMRDEACDASLGEYPSSALDGQGWPGPIDEWRACARCSNKPLGETSYYFAPEAGSEAKAAGIWCTWRCVAGYFSELGSDGQQQQQGEVCKPCTPMTAENCKPGFIHRPCSSETNEDASCSEPCDAEALGKPGGNSDETSEWVWTTLVTVEGTGGSNDAGRRLALNPSGGMDGSPNQGCMWRCKAGFRVKVISDYGKEGSEGLGDSVGNVFSEGSSAVLRFCVPL